MKETFDYIIKFLLHGNELLAEKVGYTNDPSLFSQFNVVIVRSKFFDEDVYGTQKSEPQLPLKEISGTPFLFGDSIIEQQGKTKIIYADIIASTFYLISRYEEMIHPLDMRDSHGRFQGKLSISFRAGFLHRPIVDEYSRLLLNWLSESNKVTFPLEKIDKVYLTHDIDCIAYYRNLRGFLGGVKRNLLNREGLKQVFKSLNKLTKDPAYTFNWMLEEDNSVPQAKKLYFIKSPIQKHRCDNPSYSLSGKDFQQLISLLKDNGCSLGLHTSYFSGENCSIISKEKEQLEKVLNTTITKNRWHFLRTLCPTDFEHISESGITDDFSMGYADISGFRLGTSRCVNWINPSNFNVTSLRLHPLIAMDCTFSNSYYMNLTEEQAFNYILGLLSQVKKHNGEAVLLWHNTIFSSIENTYHKSLYNNIIKVLKR